MAINIIHHPTDRSVAPGQRVVLRVNASGVAPLTYQWFRGEEKISGANSNSLIIRSIAQHEFDSYYVTVTDGDNCVVASDHAAISEMTIGDLDSLERRIAAIETLDQPSISSLLSSVSEHREHMAHLTEIAERFEVRLFEKTSQANRWSVGFLLGGLSILGFFLLFGYEEVKELRAEATAAVAVADNKLTSALAKSETDLEKAKSEVKDGLHRFTESKVLDELVSSYVLKTVHRHPIGK